MLDACFGDFVPQHNKKWAGIYVCRIIYQSNGVCKYSINISLLNGKRLFEMEALKSASKLQNLKSCQILRLYSYIIIIIWVVALTYIIQLYSQQSSDCSFDFNCFLTYIFMSKIN